jgi:hypothetical protein
LTDLWRQIHGITDIIRQNHGITDLWRQNDAVWPCRKRTIIRPIKEWCIVICRVSCQLLKPEPYFYNENKTTRKLANTPCEIWDNSYKPTEITWLTDLWRQIHGITDIIRQNHGITDLWRQNDEITSRSSR